MNDEKTDNSGDMPEFFSEKEKQPESSKKMLISIIKKKTN